LVTLCPLTYPRLPSHRRQGVKSEKSGLATDVDGALLPREVGIGAGSDQSRSVAGVARHRYNLIASARKRGGALEDQEEGGPARGEGEQPPAMPVTPEDRAPGSQTATPKGRRKADPTKDQLDRDLVRWTRALAFFTGALVLGAGLQFWAMRGQLAVMQSQLDVMSADQRPWVSIEHLSISGPLAYDSVGWQLGKRWHIKLTYTLKNYGKTPATHVIFWAHTTLIPSFPARHKGIGRR